MYNRIADVAETDRDYYMDKVFGNNVLERFIPFMLSGNIDMEQFVHKSSYNAEMDMHFLKIARTIEYYRRNWQSELKPYSLDWKNINLSGRQKKSFEMITQFLNLVSKDQKEFNKLVNLVWQSHLAYRRMLSGGNLLTSYLPELNVKNHDEPLKTDVEQVDCKPDYTSLKIEVINQVEQGNTEVYEIVNVLNRKWKDEDIDKIISMLKFSGDLVEHRSGFVELLR